METSKFRKVGSLDGNTLLRDENNDLHKVVRGEIQSDDLWSEPLLCSLIVHFDTDQPRDIRIAGMGKEDLPDGFEFQFKGNNGEEYSGNLCWS